MFEFLGRLFGRKPVVVEDPFPVVPIRRQYPTETRPTLITRRDAERRRASSGEAGGTLTPFYASIMDGVPSHHYSTGGRACDPGFDTTCTTD